MLSLVVTILKRDLYEKLVLRWGILIEFFSTLTFLIVFYLIDKFQIQLFGPDFSKVVSLYHTNYFGYVTLGLAVSHFSSLSFGGVLGQFYADRGYQLFEYTMASPLSLRSWCLLSGVSNFIKAVAQFILIFLCATLILRLALPSFNYFLAALVMALSVVPFWCMSTISLYFVLILRKGDPVGMALGMVMEILGGVYAPVELLPKFLQVIGELIPITPALRALHLVVYQQGTFYSVRGELGELLLMSLVYLPLAFIFLEWLDRKCRQQGAYIYSAQ